MERLQAVAIRSSAQIQNGKTEPLIVGCQDIDGNDKGDYVVKLNNHPQMFTITSSIAEYVCSLLAHALNLKCPSPALIEIPMELAEFAPLTLAEDVRKNRGINFGCRYIKDNHLWIPNSVLNDTHKVQAAAIYAFDAFIYNDDRGTQVNKHNMFVHKDDFVIFDHEMALSFLYLIPRPTEPWKIGSAEHLRKHLFWQSLKGHNETIPWESIMNGYTALYENSIHNAICASIPEEWQNDNTQSSIDKILEHCTVILEHTFDFFQQLQLSLQ